MKKNFRIMIAAFMLMVFAGCSDFLDINDDPNNPLDVRVSQLLPSIQERLAANLGMSGLSNSTSFLMHQNVTRGNLNDYDVQPSTAAGVWNSLYQDCLTDIREIIRISEENDYPQYLGAAQIMKAHIYSVLVDYWGDVPFSDANQGALNPTPTFEGGEAIYDAIFAMIDEGIANIDKTTTFPIRAEDRFYGAQPTTQVARWKKYARTLKLKLYNQIRLKRNVSAQVNALIATPSDLIESEAEDLQFAYGTSSNPDNRHPFYAGQYAAGSKTSPNPYFYEVMTGQNTFGHNGDLYGALVDPRVPYYFYNQSTSGQVPPNPTAYRSATGFISIYSFSFNIDPNEGFDQSAFATVQGLYPIGGRYDNGAGVDAVNNGFAITPQRMLTNYDRLFILAELAQAGVISATAVPDMTNTGDIFRAAMVASFSKVNQVATAAGAPVISDASRNAYINSVMAHYNTADAETQLRSIMTQKWIASYGFSVDAFTDYRRTGFPLLHDGNTDNRPTTIRTRDYVVSFPYPDNEIQLNPNSPDQRNQYLSKVFWQN